ncbi:2145_t:CDS:2, partial [Acaulospora morrowiae]
DEVVNEVGLKIDNNDISDAEIYNPINKLDVVGEQVKVTDVFVVDFPEKSLRLDDPWLQLNEAKIDFVNKNLTLLDDVDVPLVVKSEIPALVQG